jgi:hypothetical protein
MRRQSNEEKFQIIGYQSIIQVQILEYFDKILALGTPGVEIRKKLSPFESRQT